MCVPAQIPRYVHTRTVCVFLYMYTTFDVQMIAVLL